jgi:hypothetical protein
MLTLEGAVVVGAANVGAFGAGLGCNGLNAVLTTHTVTSLDSENTLFFAGKLTPVSLQPGTYNTTNSGGLPLAVRVVVQ